MRIKINGLLRVILYGMQNLNVLPLLTPASTDILWGRPCKTVQPHNEQLDKKWKCLQLTQYPLVRYDDDCSSEDYQHGNHYCGLPWQCNIEKDFNSGAPNDKDVYRKATILSFLMSLGSACIILIAVYVSRVSEENERRLLAFYIVIGTSCTWCNGLGNRWVMTCTFLLRIDSNSNTDWYTFGI